MQISQLMNFQNKGIKMDDLKRQVISSPFHQSVDQLTCKDASKESINYPTNRTKRERKPNLQNIFAIQMKDKQKVLNNRILLEAVNEKVEEQYRSIRKYLPLKLEESVNQYQINSLQQPTNQKILAQQQKKQDGKQLQ